MADPEAVLQKERTIKHDNVTLTAEEMKAGGDDVKMPNLPKPLTLQEKKYLLAVERGDLGTVKKMLTKAYRVPDYMNMNCLDPMGRGSISIAIANESMEMLEMLVVMGVETKDALLQAIDAEFVEAVEVLLEHEAVVHKAGTLYSWETVDSNIGIFTSDITPLILAAHKDNYEILKLLLDRGAMVPMPHDIRCGCPTCLETCAEDSLTHSRSRINAYRALASPSLIALSSTDPILTTFELSWELKNLAINEQEFKQEYTELRYQVMQFSYELLNHTRSSTELAVILNHDPSSIHVYKKGEHMTLKRLELAIDYKQKSFVSHPNNQQLLAAIWYEGLPGFRRLNDTQKCMEIIKIIGSFPMWCTMYMIFPNSTMGKRLRTPFMKFLIHAASYLFFLQLLIMVSVQIEDQVIYYLGTDAMRERLIESQRRQRGNLPTPTECAILIYVFGFLYAELKEILRHGIKKYMSNMWNLMDLGREGCYVVCIQFRIMSFWQQRNEIINDPQMAYQHREEWATLDPQLLSEGFFAAANILSALKLVHIFSINPHLGPLQISLGRMFIDILKFFCIYTLVLFAFTCGMTQLLWYYNDLEKQKCYSLPNGEADWVHEGDACMRWRRFYNLFETSQSMFWASFGMIGLSDFELTGIKEYTRVWSMTMFGTYSIINIIVLLNLLIAMMSSSYAFIVEHADTEWKFARTKLWMSYFETGSTLPPPFNIFPNVKHLLNLTGRKFRMQGINHSASMKRRQSEVRDFRYLAVMRALVWRYVRSLQKKNEERQVNEDDINEVKGDISSLRFELVDLFGANGMDVTMCAKKNNAAMGRKMKIWERRLMRDFHVSPAMGNVNEAEKPPEKMKNRFKKVAKIAIASKQLAADRDRSQSIISVASQIGIGDLEHQDKLKAAMEKTRRRLDDVSPDGSPSSSRGCSPYPDMDMGPPDLLDAIKSLHFTPTPTPHSPLPITPRPDGQATEIGMLTIPGRRAQKNKESADAKTDLMIDVPKSIFSPSAMNELKKNAKNAPVTLTSENEKSDILKKAETQITVEDDSKQPKNKEQHPAMMVTPSTPTPYGRKGSVVPQKPQSKTPPPPSIQNKAPPPPAIQNKAPPPPAIQIKAPPPQAIQNKAPPPQAIQNKAPPPPTIQNKAPTPAYKPVTNAYTSKSNDDLESIDVVRRPKKIVFNSDTSKPNDDLESIDVVRHPKKITAPVSNADTSKSNDNLEDTDFVRRPKKITAPGAP